MNHTTPWGRFLQNQTYTLASGAPRFGPWREVRSQDWRGAKSPCRPGKEKMLTAARLLDAAPRNPHRRLSFQKHRPTHTGAGGRWKAPDLDQRSAIRP